MSLDVARKCASRGACLLDRRVPGWFRQIDWNRFSLMSPKRDLLGQLFPDNTAGMRVLGLPLVKSEAAARLGFVTILGSDNHPAITTANELEKAWREMANQRLSDIKETVFSR
jgi:hypothetical protein